MSDHTTGWIGRIPAMVLAPLSLAVAVTCACAGAESSGDGQDGDKSGAEVRGWVYGSEVDPVSRDTSEWIGYDGDDLGFGIRCLGDNRLRATVIVFDRELRLEMLDGTGMAAVAYRIGDDVQVDWKAWGYSTTDHTVTAPFLTENEGRKILDAVASSDEGDTLAVKIRNPAGSFVTDAEFPLAGAADLALRLPCYNAS